MTSAKLCGQCVCLGGGLGDTGEGIWQGECQHFCDGDSTAQKTLSPPPIPCMRRPKKQKMKKKSGSEPKNPLIAHVVGTGDMDEGIPPSPILLSYQLLDISSIYSTLYIVGLSIYYSTKYKSCWISYIYSRHACLVKLSNIKSYLTGPFHAVVGVKAFHTFGFIN